MALCWQATTACTTGLIVSLAAFLLQYPVFNTLKARLLFTFFRDLPR